MPKSKGMKVQEPVDDRLNVPDCVINDSKLPDQLEGAESDSNEDEDNMALAEDDLELDNDADLSALLMEEVVFDADSALEPDVVDVLEVEEDEGSSICVVEADELAV